MIPRPDEYLSYLMGAPKLPDRDLTSVGVTIVETTHSGSRHLIVPESALQAYEELLRERLAPGYWNEIVGRNRIIFYFQLSDGPFTERVYSDTTRGEIARLCSELNDDPLERTSNITRYLAGNALYTELMVAHHGVTGLSEP